MWLAEKINNKKLKTFVFSRIPLLLIILVGMHAMWTAHINLVLYWLLFMLVFGWLPTKIGWSIARALFPSLPVKCDVASWRWRIVVIVGALVLLMILFNFLFYYHVGVPEWALLKELDPRVWWLQGNFISMPIAALTAEFVAVLCFAWRLQRKKRQ